MSVPPLIPFHGFSSALKSLCMTFTSLPLSDVFDLIYPFPLPEDLCIVIKAMFSPGFNGRPAIVKPPTPPPVYKRPEDILEWNAPNFGRMYLFLVLRR